MKIPEIPEKPCAVEQETQYEFELAHLGGIYPTDVIVADKDNNLHGRSLTASLLQLSLCILGYNTKG